MTPESGEHNIQNKLHTIHTGGSATISEGLCFPMADSLWKTIW